MPALALLILNLVIGYDYLKDRHPKDLAFVFWVSIVLILVLSWLIFTLRLKKFEFSLSKTQFSNLIKELCLKNKWSIDYEFSSDDRIRAFSSSSQSYSGTGELITIINYTDSIYVNSVCDPNSGIGSLFSYGKNRVNRKTVKLFFENHFDG